MLSCHWSVRPMHVLPNCCPDLNSRKRANGTCAGNCSPPWVSLSSAGGLDRSTHPFSLLAGTNDVRLTIRVNESDLSTAVLAALHEGGHGLYDQGFDPNDRHACPPKPPTWIAGIPIAPVGKPCRTQPRVWDYVFPRLQRLFPDAVKECDAEAFYRSVNVVRPGLIRVAADEVSYHLHIVLRYELEVALISGSLGVGDLPEAWNARSASLIGATPPSDREGVLQDVHWSLGMFGYLPTYTLGSVYAAQLAETYARASVPWTTRSGAASLAGYRRGFALIFIELASALRQRKSSPTPLARDSIRGPFFATSKRNACPDQSSRLISARRAHDPE